MVVTSHEPNTVTVPVPWLQARAGPPTAGPPTALQPRWAIASTRELAPTVTPLLRSQRTQLYQTGEDGAITWTANQGWRAALDSIPSDQPL